jgi:Asp/Glu/hydantoin racemase
VLLGGAALAGMAGLIQKRVPVPLIDGIATAVVFAEGIVRLRLPKPRLGGYAAPANRHAVGLGEALSALLRRG